MIPQPDKTCALVVGIETCGLGDDWKLPGAKIGAERFAAWVRKQGVPQDHIYSLPDATVSNVRTGFDRLKQERQDCDCLLLYWAGHGFATENNKRGLFLRDATTIEPMAFNPEAFVEYLRNETPNLKTQVGIIDACATGRRSSKVLFQDFLEASQLPRGSGNIHFIFSAPAGRETSYPDDGEPSLFTRDLLAMLDTETSFDALIAALKKNYPLYERTELSEYWLFSSAFSRALALEQSVCALGAPLNLKDAEWRAQIRRLEPAFDTGDSTFQEIVARLSGWDPELAVATCTGLLLLGARAAKQDLRPEILASAVLAPGYEAAAERTAKLREFENPCYLITTDYRPDNQLGATRVSFLSGQDQDHPQLVKEWNSPVPFIDAFAEAADHMEDNAIGSGAAIQLATPLGFLLRPQPDMLEQECDFPIVFREKTRTFSLGKFRTRRLGIQALLLKAKQRAAQSFTVGWFDPTDADRWGSVEFPVIRTGNCPDAEARVEELIGSLAPFAAITRPSITSLAAVNEVQLAAVARGGTFAGIPLRLYESRTGPNSVSPHITVIWDDPQLPRGYSEPTGAKA